MRIERVLAAMTRSDADWRRFSRSTTRVPAFWKVAQRLPRGPEACHRLFAVARCVDRTMILKAIRRHLRWCVAACLAAFLAPSDSRAAGSDSLASSSDVDATAAARSVLGNYLGVLSLVHADVFPVSPEHARTVIEPLWNAAADSPLIHESTTIPAAVERATAMALKTEPEIDADALRADQHVSRLALRRAGGRVLTIAAEALDDNVYRLAHEGQDGSTELTVNYNFSRTFMLRSGVETVRGANFRLGRAPYWLDGKSDGVWTLTTDRNVSWPVTEERGAALFALLDGIRRPAGSQRRRASERTFVFTNADRRGAYESVGRREHPPKSTAALRYVDVQQCRDALARLRLKRRRQMLP